MKKLFSATLGDLRYLKDRDYLSNKGLEWLEDMERLGEGDEEVNVECEQ